MNRAIEAAAKEFGEWLADRLPEMIMPTKERAVQDAAEALTTILRKHFAEPAERADQWQDIATAPKDGTPILLRDGSIVGSGQYGRTEPWSMRKLDGFYFDGASLPSLATHWCHLPLPPPEVTDDQA